MTDELKPLTRSDLKIERDKFKIVKLREYVKETVEKIYYGVRKAVVEVEETCMHGNYYHVINWQTYWDVKLVAEAICEELDPLFPSDFEINIGRIGECYEHDRCIHIKW